MNHSEAIRLLIEVAKHGNKEWDGPPIFRDGYKKISSGLIGDIRKFLRLEYGVDLEKVE